jgi:hypothetical protein
MKGEEKKLIPFYYEQRAKLLLNFTKTFVISLNGKVITHHMLQLKNGVICFVINE